MFTKVHSTADSKPRAKRTAHDTGSSVGHKVDTPLPDHQQSHGPGTGNTHKRSTLSLEGRLLTCILSLMQPMISAYIGTADEHVEAHLQKVAASDEGDTLICALNNFIKVGVRAALQETEKSSAMSYLDSKTKNTRPISDATAYLEQPPKETYKKLINGIQPHVPIPMEVRPTELQSMIQRQTRAHVFNIMPIRMLEFDAEGSNIKLIGRDDIFRILILRVQKKITVLSFQQDWNEALGLQDLDDIWYTHRSNRLRKLVEAVVSESSSFAILSHTWIRESPGDVVYSTWEHRLSNDRGWRKVESFCRIAARNHRMTLGWVDSICINKDSSSELDESIRSMYKWYRGSHVCITYLSETESLGDGAHDSWFTRGWTLQELLAPKNMAFYNHHWKMLGSHNDSAIISLVTAETSITAEEMLIGRSGDIKDIPISRILQMASQRQVTREEDSSYSLLGLLDINISVAYGEGAKSAFRRLFQELLVTRKHVIDLFNRQYFRHDSLIPSSLKMYSYSSRIFDKYLQAYQPPEPIVLTHLGVRCQWLFLPSLAVERGSSDEIYVPKGKYSCQFSATVTFGRDGECKLIYNLLDTRLYDHKSDYTIPPSSCISNLSVPRPTFLVPMFNLKEDVLSLPDCVLAMLADIPDKPGKVHSGSKIYIMPQTRPCGITLKASTGSSRVGIPIKDLELHGMQLVTLYL